MAARLTKQSYAVDPVRQTGSTVKTILLPLDDAAHSRFAVSVACGLSQLYGAALRVINVGQRKLDSRELTSCLGPWVHDLRNIVLDRATGDSVEYIIRLSHNLPDSLLVMSTDVGHTTKGSLFGSFSESILATRPKQIVLLAPAHHRKTWSLKRILLAHDGTPGCRPATCAAAELAQRARTEVIALHIATRGKRLRKTPGTLHAPMYVDQPQHEWPSWAEEFMSRLIAAGAPAEAIHFRPTVRAGQPGSEVAKYARECAADLVVMAWHGHWEKERSATKAVIQTAACPVLLALAQNNPIAQ
jgi:nucleotide-binding universal stress UspA family protein